MRVTRDVSVRILWCGRGRQGEKTAVSLEVSAKEGHNQGTALSPSSTGFQSAKRALGATIGILNRQHYEPFAHIRTLFGIIENMLPTSYRHLTVRTEQGVLILAITEPQLTGEELCADVRGELLDAVTKTGARRIVVDLQQVQYVSSVAFRPFLSLSRLARDSGARLVLCNLSKLVAEIFHATRLLITSHSSTAPFQEQPSVAAAIAFLSQDRPEDA